MIKIENVSLKFKEKTVLDKVSYTFADTGFYVIQGETGSGKSSLLNCISGVYRVNEGQIYFSDGFNLQNDLYYTISESNLVPSLSVVENAALIFSESKVKEVLTYIDKYDLGYTLKRAVSKLSSGETQKISLIFALVRRAKITLLDEPLCNVDKESLPLFYEELKELGKTSLVIAVMHQPISFNMVNGLLEITEKTIKEKFLSLSSSPIISDENEISWSKAFKNCLILFVKRPKLLFTLFSVFLFITVYILVASILLNTTSDTCLYARGLADHSLQFVTIEPSDYDALKPVEKVHVEYSIDRGNGVPVYMFDYFDTIYMTDFIYSQGEKISLGEDDVWISDYLYGILTEYYSDQGVYFPTTPLKDYVASGLRIGTEINYSWNLPNVNFFIYKTDYLKHLPDKNSIKYGSELRKFKELVDNFYMNVYASPSIVAKLYTDSKDHDWFLLSDLLVEEGYPTISTISSRLLEGNEFYCSENFFINTLGYSQEEVETPGFVDGVVDGKSFCIEFKSNTTSVVKTLVLKAPGPIIYIDSRSAMYSRTIYLSKSMLEELYTELDCSDANNLAIRIQTDSFIDTKAPDFDRLVEQVLKDEDVLLLQRENVNAKIQARDSAKEIFITISCVCAGVIAFVILLYCCVYAKNEIKELSFLSLKGYRLNRLIFSRYFIEGILTIMILALSLLILYWTSPYVALAFNML